MSPRKRKCPYSDEIQRLLPVFAALLSQRQRECLHAHHIEGKGLSQIARRLGISRQAVLDAVRHGEQHLLDIGQCIRNLQNTPDRALPQLFQPYSSLHDQLIELRDRIAREGIIYSPRWIVDELDTIIAGLAQVEATPADKKF